MTPIHFEAISLTVAIGVAGLTGGALVAVSLPEVPIATMVGAGLGTALALGAASAAKNWVEKQIGKLIEMPTKTELYAKIDSVAEDVRGLRDLYSEEIYPLKDRILRIEERHILLDRSEGR